jgi:hypothetical protein
MDVYTWKTRLKKKEKGSRMSHQNMPLWQKDYFELKAIQKRQTQEKLYFPLINR